MKWIFSTLCLFFMLDISAQTAEEYRKNGYIPTIVGDDTTWAYKLPEFKIEKTDVFFNAYKNKVVKIYPLVDLAVDYLKEIDKDDNSTASKSEKKTAKKINSELKEKFKYTIKDMSRSEGEILVKLIHQKTGMSAYNIISKFRGNSKAVLWQSISRVGGADLKNAYNPNTDHYLRRCLKLIEKGELKVNKEPTLLSKSQFKDEKKESKKLTKSTRKRNREARKKEPK